MSVLPTSSSQVRNDVSQPTAQPVAPQTSSSGISSVGSSMSSAAENQGNCHEIFTLIFSPFVAIKNFISDGVHEIKNFLASLFSAPLKADRQRYAYIAAHLNEISTTEHQECLGKFFHISNPLIQLKAFRLIQTSEQTTPETVHAFFVHLPVTLQDHVKRHAWEANGCNDEGMGIYYGNYMVEQRSKDALITQGIDKCIQEQKNA